MRKSFILTLALSLFIMIPLSASAAQFSMLYGLMNSPSGGVKLYSNQSKYAFETFKAPTGLYLGSDNLRVGYMEYKLIAADGGSVSSNSIVAVQTLSFEYQEVLPSGGFYHAGVANFTSQFYYQYYTNGYSDDISLDNRGYTDKIIDPGLIGGGGWQFQFGNVFLAAELIYIFNKTVDYKYMDTTSTTWQVSTSSDYSADVGIMIIGMSAGTNF